MKKCIIPFLMICCISFYSCNKSEKKQVTQIVEQKVEATEEKTEEPEVEEIVDKKFSGEEFDLTKIESKGKIFSAAAHEKYLKDELKFDKKLDDFGIDQTYTFLVRSNECKFYPLSALELVNEEEHRYKFVDCDNCEFIPLGTILPVISGDPILSAGDEWYEQTYGYFFVDGAYNFFKKTKWQEQEGYVFGAYVQWEDKLTNQVNSELYKQKGVLKDFYAMSGYKELSEAVQNSLLENKLAFEMIPWSYGISDEMIDMYTHMEKMETMFVTTDLAAHSQHRIFDNLLAQIEEDFFAPNLLKITEKFIAKLSERNDLPEEVKHLAIAYFQVPEAILKTAPQKYIDESSWRKEVNYREVDAESVLKDYPEDVKADYEQVKNNSGRSTVIFGTKEDFSQYKPRGHYTKTELLKSYFMAQMWYGRIHFCIAASGANPIGEAETEKMEPVAMAIIDTVHRNPELYEEWKKLFDPITTLIGMSDDLGFSDVLPLWKDQNVSDFNAWVTDKDKLNSFIKLCHAKLRPPAISGNSVYAGPSEVEGDQIKPPMGWRFLGQRFTYDSDVHQQVCAPVLYSRDLVRGLDIMKAFGSKTAEVLLNKTDYNPENKDSNYYGGTELKNTLDKKQKFFEECDESFWSQTYYNSVLNQVKTQAVFEQGSGFYFTESPLWNIKALNSAHATWAELRHDTILYVKQCYAERAGDGDLDPTWKYIPLPEPVNYIEPNLAFWECSLVSVEKLYNVLNENNLIDEDISKKLKRLSDIYAHAVNIVKLEIEDKEVSERDNKWIRTIPSLYFSMILENSDSYVDEDFKKMACIADVFTNAEKGVCLEVGVGKPYKIYVPLNDHQGGKRIAIGYVPSYYEFYGQQSDRMTDEEWKSIVYNEKSNMKKYEPFWIEGCIIR